MNADQNEMETLHTIAEKLQIEDSFFKKILADKAMRIHSGDPDAAEKMLGLTPKMSPDERKKRLLDLAQNAIFTNLFHQTFIGTLENTTRFFHRCFKN